MPIGEHVVQDYKTLSLTLRSHPCRLLRDRLAADGYAPTERLSGLRHGGRISVAGLVLVRQRPGTAKGIIFITLEDESGIANLVIMPNIFEAFRREVLGARLLGAAGRVERAGDVIHLKVDRLYNLSSQLLRLTEEYDRDTPPLGGRGYGAHPATARADEVRRPTGDHREINLQKARSFH